ncbi:hypothetical protein HPB52_000743 [Rhipicephalus sanguineus]|uniref:Uncharacterized protein n=1 Tax=Rhipicephalus sanguineus TaxID=34632 RepID=A0A9D4PGH2_RHISA|nr:hypothetical protein HPB52_000743 [Rhipicephalus sanguineus]
MWPALNARTRAAPTSRWAVTRVTLSNESTDSTASEVSATFRAITLPLRALGLPLVPLTEPATASNRKICLLVGLVLFAYAVRLLVAFFARLCYMLSNSTLRFMLTLESEFTNARASEIKAVRKVLLRLSRISDVANALNRTYGAIFSWWYAELTASFLLGVPSCILVVSGGAEFSEYAFSLVDLVRDMTVFMTMSFVASEIAKNVSDSLHYALRVTNTIEDRNVDLNFALLLENLVCHIEDAKVELSGAEFFHVDRALINRVLFLVSTFAIILYQFLS